ncbi:MULTISPECIES: multicopper oxidase domain-containing protein [Methylobacter]
MLISTNIFKKFKRKALPLAIASVLGSCLYQLPANAALPTSAACTGTGTVSCELWAKPGTATLTSGVTVPVWGYAAAAADPAGLPGPVLIVNQGDTVTVTLHNALSEPTALLFQGQSLPPDTVGTAAGGNKSYTFTASEPGTYMYEAGLPENTQHQPAMGLYGALVVRPATPNQAYGATTAFDDEALVLVSEIDTALNNSANPAGFDMRKFAPKYFLINGKVHPSPDLITLPDPVATPYPASGFNLLLRYVNAGIKHHSMALLGLRQKFIANDGSLILHPRDGVSETIAPGQTVDAITTISSAAVPDSRFAVYDAGMNLNNSSAAGMGGMLTFVALGGDGVLPTPGTPPAPPGPPTDTAGPVTSGITMTPNPSNAATIALSATGNDTSTGNSNVDAAEYFIDAASPPSDATRGVFMPVASPGAVAIAAASITAPVQGAHNILVRSRDAANNWGAFAPAVSLIQDTAGPSTTVTPIASNGKNGVNSSTAAARIVAKATDNLTNVSAIEGYIDSNTTSVFPFVPSDGSFNSLSENAYADIPLATVTALSSGDHVVHVRARDAAGNWGAFTNTNNLLVDKTPPTMTTGSFNATPSPTFSTFTLSATATDAPPTLGIAGGEWYEGADPGNGLGHPMGNTSCPAGKSICSTENVQTLGWAIGNHTVNIRAKDAAGNWTTATINGVVVSDLFFANSFTSTTSPYGWSSRSGNNAMFSVNPAANLIGTGTNGLQINLGGSTTSRYVQDNTPNNENTYHARFYFNPNGALPSGTNVITLLRGLGSTGVVLFQVQFQRTAAGQYQMRVANGAGFNGSGNSINTGSAVTAWSSITNAAHYVEVAFNRNATNPGSRLQMLVDGVSVGFLNYSAALSNNNATRVGSVQFGAVTGNVAAASGSIYLDGFVSTRTLSIGP